MSVADSEILLSRVSGLEHLKKSLRRTDSRTGGGERPYEDCLKGWLREDEEDKEPDER